MTTDPRITIEKRRASAEWQIDATHYTVLSVHHFPEKRAFTATLRRETEEDCGTFKMRAWSFGDSLRVDVERVGRYSDKALAGYFARILERVTAGRESDYAGMFTPSAEVAAA